MTTSASPFRFGLMATGDFALPILQLMIAQNTRPEALLTKPPKRRGRGMKYRNHPVLQFALDNNVPAVTLNGVKCDDLTKAFKSKVDLIVVIDFGHILTSEVLSWPTYGCINLHGSLLPRWRGADPVRRTLLAGDSIAGVTVQNVVRQVDAGPILSQASICVDKDDNYSQLHTTLAKMGARLMLETISEYIKAKRAGSSPPQGQEQDVSKVTFAKKFDMGLRVLSHNLSTKETLARIRALAEKPGALLAGENPTAVLKAEEIHIGATQQSDLPQSTRFIHAGEPCLRCTDGIIRLLLLRPSGRNLMTGQAFVNGHATRFLADYP